MGVGSSRANVDAYLCATPFFVIFQPGTETGTLLMQELAKLAIITSVARHKVLKMPKKAGESAFAICVAGGFTDDSADADVHEEQEGTMTIKPGDFWCSFAASTSHLRAATKSKILFLPQSAITAVTQVHGLNTRDTKMLQTLARMDLLAVMQSVPYFAKLERRSLASLAALLSFEAFATGQAIYRSGDAADAFYILAAGEVELSIDGKRVLTSSAPTFFGSTALVDDKTKRTYTATVTDAGSCAVLTLARPKFARFKERFREVAADIEQLILREVRGRMLSSALVAGGVIAPNAIFSIPMQEQLRLFMDLGGCVTLVRMAKGDVVLSADVPATSVFIIYEGLLSEIGRGEDSGRELKPGAFLGDASVLAQSAEKSTVIAKTSSLVLAVDGAEFTKLISLLPALKTVLSLRLVEMVSVEELLLLEPAAAELLRFMEGEFVTESYYFLDEQGKWAEQMRQNATKDAIPPDLASRAQAIISKFIGGGAEQELNLPDHVSKKVHADFAANAYSASLFNQARAEVLRLVTLDTLPRFVKSAAFAALRTRYGAYPVNIFPTAAERDAALLQAAEPYNAANKKAQKQQKGADTKVNEWTATAAQAEDLNRYVKRVSEVEVKV